MDLKSILGYSIGSPFAGNPYLDINTPDGYIDMSKTPIDLLGIDNKGNKKKMKAGRKNPYKFDGDMVREIPMGNIYQVGGLTDPLRPKDLGVQTQDNTRRLPLFDPVLVENTSAQSRKELPVVGPARKEYVFEKNRNDQRRNIYAASQPNAQIVNGQLTEKNPAYTMEGEPFGPNEKRFQKGMEHIAGGLEAAGYLTGAGELYNLGKPLMKKAATYLTEQTALKNTYKLNPWTFKPNSKNIYKRFSTPDWALEEMKFATNPKLNNREASQVLENFRERIKTPEGKKRLEDLGITDTKVFDRIEILSDKDTYGRYWNNKIGLNPELPEFKNVTRHEIEHSVQDAIGRSKMDKLNYDNGNFKYLFRPKAKLKVKEEILKQNSNIDNLLSDIELRKTPEKVDWSIKDNKKPDPSNLFNYMSDKQRATNYFDSGSGGREKSAFLAEVQQYMMDTGTIPKTSYTTVTPEMVKNTFVDAMFDEKTNGKYLRMFNIIKPTDNNYNILAKGLNKMLGIVPAVVGTGVGVSKNNQYQQGGRVYDFLFGDDKEDEEDDKYVTSPEEPTAPVAEDIQSPEMDDYEMSLQMAMSISDDPFEGRREMSSLPHGIEDAEIMSSGRYGSQHVGEYGKQIYSKLSSDLGYNPVANSIYRDPSQQAELVRQGVGVKNSWHLTGNAIDLKPQDWNKLSRSQQSFYRNNYDVVYHNNHYHIEPRQ